MLATVLTPGHTNECFDYISPNGTKSLLSGDNGQPHLVGVWECEGGGEGEEWFLL